MKWDEIKDTLGKVAPVLGTLVGGPAGTAVGALVANALGVENDPKAVAASLASPEKQADLQKWAYEHKEKLENLALQKLKTELNDTQDARQNHKHSKVPAVIVSVLTILVSSIIFMLFNNKLPDANKDLAYILLGQVSALWGASVNYWVGTTRSSAEKTKWSEMRIKT